jgi:hypothetical protein
MANKQNLASAVSQSPSEPGEGPQIFFDPSIICASTNRDSKEKLNEALLFHESLHGYQNYDPPYLDPDLQAKFGQTVGAPSVNITYYLESSIFSVNLSYLHDSATDPEPMQCPN